MPLDTPYNQRIAKKLYEINKNHINTEILNSEKILHNNILTPLEHAIDNNNTNYVGSGHQAVVQQEIKLAENAVDQQSTKPVFLDGVPSPAKLEKKGLTSSMLNVPTPETKHKRKSKAKKDDTTAMVIDKPIEPLSGSGTSGAGVSAAVKPKKVKKEKGGLLSLASLSSMKGQPPDTINAKITVAAKPSLIKEKDKSKAKKLDEAKAVEDKPAEDMKTEPAITGGAKKRKVKKPKEAGEKKANERNELVKKIMLEQKLSLPLASKYIKDNNLYKKS